MTDRSFSIDVAAIRERARANMTDGAVTRAHTTYETTADDDLVSMLKENLAAERIVISTYQEIIRWLGDGDITTRRLMESILDEEERHANDILDLLGSLDGGSKPGSSHNP